MSTKKGKAKPSGQELAEAIIGRRNLKKALAFHERMLGPKEADRDVRSLSTKKGKAKPRLVRNDQGMPGWNVYCGLKQRFTKITSQCLWLLWSRLALLLVFSLYLCLLACLVLARPCRLCPKCGNEEKVGGDVK